MGNSTETTIDLGNVAIGDDESAFEDELLTSGGATTYLAGTILARHSGTLKLIPFVKGGSSNENGIPKAVLTYPVESLGAGDIPVRALLKGHVNRDRLIIHGDGDGSNVDAAVCDQLRSYAIVTQHVSQLANIATPGDS